MIGGAGGFGGGRVAELVGVSIPLCGSMAKCCKLRIGKGSLFSSMFASSSPVVLNEKSITALFTRSVVELDLT